VLKSLFFSSVVVLIASGQAIAADSLVVTPVQASPKWLPYNWTGFYFGGNIGYGFGKSQTDAWFSDAGMGTPLFATGSSTHFNGALGGGQTGYNWQAGPWIAGLEADIQSTRQRATKTYVCPGANCNSTTTGLDVPVSHSHELDWFATVRARFGVTVTPDALLYGTGGYAIAGISHVGTISGSNLVPLLDANANPVLDTNGNPIATIGTNSVSFLNHTRRSGWAVGGGVEARLTGNLTGKIEYLHMDFGSDSFNASNPMNGTPIALVLNSRITDDIVRVGLNYKPDANGLGGGHKLGPVYKSRSILKTPAEAIWTWAGFYLGFNVGYGSGRSDAETLFSDATLGAPLTSTNSPFPKLNGVMFGAQAGHNWVAGHWLAGVELDVESTNQRSTLKATCPGVICNPAITDFDAPVTAGMEQRLEWFSTLRGRLGAIVNPDTMAYVTGGLAVGRISTVGTLAGSSLTLTPTVDNAGNPILDANGNPIIASAVGPVTNAIVESTTKAGWSVGGGVERHLGANLTGRVEYLHLDFGNISRTTTILPMNSTPLTFSYNHRATDDILRVGVNYKLDPDIGPQLLDRSRMTLPDPQFYNWTGFYFGSHFGYTAGYSLWSAPEPAMAAPALAGSLDFFRAFDGFKDTGSYYLGFQGGYSYMFPSRLLIGVEADASFPSNVHGIQAIASPLTGVATYEEMVQWSSTVRGRIGYAPGHWLIYATGGWAWTADQFTRTQIGAATDPSSSAPAPGSEPKFIVGRRGWAAGGGIELALTPSWTARLEYLYTQFGTRDVYFPTATQAFDSNLVLQSIRFGFNYRLGENAINPEVFTKGFSALDLGDFALHGQTTFVSQYAPPFHAPYHGPNSLDSNHGRETWDTTFYAGLRLWQDAELWINPEIDQGFGLSSTLGVAGFTSGEAYKVGFSVPYARIPRMFVRQTINLGGETEKVPAGIFQFAGSQTSNRLVITFGKFSVSDVFDTLIYAHDPRNDFLNWALVDAATFDYAADAWGYTYGSAIEWYQGNWTIRGGVFDLSVVPNSTDLDPHFAQVQWVGEVERRYSLWGQPGRILINGYLTRGRMGRFQDAIDLAQFTGAPADITQVRRYTSRTGTNVGWEQQLVPNVGIFARAGVANGQIEPYEFTDVDQTVAAGLSLKGKLWGRADDTFGMAGIINAISGVHQAYLNDGGLGILVGDGQLPNPGREKILETYYSLALSSWRVTFDYQYIANPAYNRDRGPVSVIGTRLHAQF
jgi:high affinity Mn2+ porin